MAGAWTEFTTSSGMSKGQRSLIEKHSAEFIADASDASIPLASKNLKGAFLCGFGAVFGTTAPSSLEVTLTDEDGLTIATATLSASGRGTLTTPVPIINEINIALAGNATNSANGTFILYTLNNMI